MLEQLQVRANAGVGIAGMGYATVGVVRAVRVQHNSGPGIVCEQMRIEHSTFAANGSTGVDCRGSWFVDTVTRHNGGHGVAEGAKVGLGITTTVLRAALSRHLHSPAPVAT